LSVCARETVWDGVFRISGIRVSDGLLEAIAFTLGAGETSGGLETDALEVGGLDVVLIVSSSPRETIPPAVRGDTNAGMIAPNSTAARMPESASLNVFILVGSEYTGSVREEARGPE
jgi:hypothetical protein